MLTHFPSEYFSGINYAKYYCRGGMVAGGKNEESKTGSAALSEKIQKMYGQENQLRIIFI